MIDTGLKHHSAGACQCMEDDLETRVQHVMTIRIFDVLTLTSMQDLIAVCDIIALDFIGYLAMFLRFCTNH